MINTEKAKTQDGLEAKNGDVIWFMVNDKPQKSLLKIGYHDRLYKIYISRAALLASVNITPIFAEVRGILKKECYDNFKNMYICTFDNKKMAIKTPVFIFALSKKESVSDIESHININEIAELTIKYK